MSVRELIQIRTEIIEKNILKPLGDINEVLKTWNKFKLLEFQKNEDDDDQEI